jgi:aminoglycoside phosphotransferase (APT) family kinase protein
MAEISSAGLLRLLREHGGLEDLAAVRPASGGESHSTFWATDRSGAVSVLKILPGAGPDAVAQLRALDAAVGRLRHRGYPAPRILAIGQVPGLVFWTQQRLTGLPLDRRSADVGRAAVLAPLLPEVFRLNNAQAGLGDRGPGWRDLIARTLTVGGDGYCVHATLQARPDTREMLRTLRWIGDRCCAAIPNGADYVHYDFTPANLLSDGRSITGVIDLNPPALAGDRAFDVATLLFYGYDYDDLRRPLSARLLELTNSRAARAYLAHMVLRQVEWSLRHYPGAAATRHHLRLAGLVMSDIGNDPRHSPDSYE